MTYTPGWIKENSAKYFRIRDAVGQPMDILSSFCALARDADKKAFAAVMQHIKSVDASERTVIMVQVENETGLLGTDRDYFPQASRAYHSSVPSELMNEAHRGPSSTGVPETVSVLNWKVDVRRGSSAKLGNEQGRSHQQAARA
jgi:Glycosyl hydrolases family 35